MGEVWNERTGGFCTAGGEGGYGGGDDWGDFVQQGGWGTEGRKGLKTGGKLKI